MPPTDRPRAATLHDVARAAGVSTITASRALSQPQRVAAATLERVREAVARTGYLPNLLAGGLKSRRSMTVGALVPVISVPQFLPTVQTLTDRLAAAGYQLILGQTGYDRAREAALLTNESTLRLRLQSTRKYSRFSQVRSVVFSTRTLFSSPVDGL
jgi:LacI family gluconate utilization system Gnt-I transcriptional repressor